MMYPNTPTTFEEIITLAPRHREIVRHLFTIGESRSSLLSVGTTLALSSIHFLLVILDNDLF